MPTAEATGTPATYTRTGSVTIEPPLPSNPSDSPIPKASASAIMRLSSIFRVQVHARQLVPHPRAGLFHGILASKSPIPHQSVRPANTSPVATNQDNTIAAGQISEKLNPVNTSNP